MTHALLVKKAATYLRSIGCKVVLTERTTGKEFHDAIGWKPSWRGFPISYVIECKVSKSDFRADKRKASRKSYEVRPAQHCFYLAPAGLLTSASMPDGWGLLELLAPHRAVTMQRFPRSGDHDDRTADQLCRRRSAREDSKARAEHDL